MPRVLGVALRKCPQLPPTIAERIKEYRAQNVADWVMYRKALASAAEARGWPVYWYDAKSVLGAAQQALGNQQRKQAQRGQHAQADQVGRVGAQHGRTERIDQVRHRVQVEQWSKGGRHTIGRVQHWHRVQHQEKR